MRVQLYLDLVPAVQAHRFAQHKGVLASVGGHFAVLLGAVAAAEGQKMHGFQQIGLAAAVGAVQNGDAGMKGKIQRGVIAEVF